MIYHLSLTAVAFCENDGALYLDNSYQALPRSSLGPQIFMSETILLCYIAIK